MRFNKNMTNTEVLYMLNYAYTLKHKTFLKMLAIVRERLDKLTEYENLEKELGINLITLFDEHFTEMAKNYINKKPFIYEPEDLQK